MRYYAKYSQKPSEKVKKEKEESFSEKEKYVMFFPSAKPIQ